MKKVIAFFRKNLFPDDKDIQFKLQNLTMFCAMIGAFATSIIGLFINSDWRLTLVEFFTLFFVGFCIYLAVWKNLQVVSSILMILITDAVLFPCMYIYSGGIHSGMVIWFVLGLIYSFLVLKGKTSYIMFTICSMCMAGVIVAEYFFPDLTTPLEGVNYVEDVIQSLILVSLIFGIIFRYQSFTYKKQNDALKEKETSLLKTLDDLTDTTNKLKKASSAKSDFLANMSHEIRTPINAILGMNEMALRENENPEIEKYLMNIKNASSNLLSLVNDVLDFSKIESGNLELFPSSYTVKSLLENCFAVVSVKAQEKDLTLTITNSPDIPSILCGDEQRVRQILINLLGNAIKYTKEGKVSLNLSFDRLPGTDDIILIADVTDTGVGISEEDLGKLFKTFQRVDEKRNRNIEGTGLGLALSQSLAQAMNGYITVKSKKGEGSTFTVRISQKIISNNPMGVFVPMDVARAEKYKESFQAPDGTVLVVDDVKMNLDVIRGLLKKTKLKLTFAMSGQEAIDVAKDQSFDVILMDIMMPEMDGVETLNKLRTNNLISADTKVVALTANAVKGASEEYLSQGFDRYLSKPVKYKDLEALLKELLPQEKLGAMD